MRSGAPPACARQRRGVERQRVAGDDLQPARPMRGDFRERARGSARRARPRSPSSRPAASSARVRPPGPGPISTTATPSSGPAARAMRPVRLRSKRKFWPSDFFAVEPVRGDDLAQRRQAVRGEAHGASARREPQRRDQARRVGEPLAGDVEGRAVIGRGAHERQAERDVDAAVEGERLGRDQPLSWYMVSATS